MKVVIADDEPLARSLLRTLLDEVPGIDVVAEAESGGEAVAMVDRHEADAVFLDIDMPGGSGIHAAHELQNRSAEVVFVTAHERHALDAFEVGAADYVLKPVRRPRLAKALQRLRLRVGDRPAGAGAAASAAETAGEPAFWVRTRRGQVRVHVADVIWIEAARDHVYFHTADRSFLHRITMRELEAKLDGTGLMRIQRSAFARLGKATRIVREGKALLLDLEQGPRLAVGPNYRKAVLERLNGLGAQ